MRSTMDWPLLLESLGFILVSTLFIANGSYSQSWGVSVSAPVCVGGGLSIQSWLAILGLEFGALGVKVIPRARSVLISKILTARLTSSGVSLANLLNSQSTAPLLTQILSGLKSTLFLRAFILITITIFSILYKFSFVLVERFDTINLAHTTPPILLGCDTSGRYDGISNNPIDALADFTSPSGLNVSIAPATNKTGASYVQIFGPSQANIGGELDIGTLYLCTPTYYSRNEITPSGTYILLPPVNTTAAYGNGIRLVNLAQESFIDIYSTEGLLEILVGTYSNVTSSYQYIHFIEVHINVCFGFTSWNINNTAPQSSFLLNPKDIACIQESFDLSS
ncbi:hypothetical protein G7Y89_g8168 [Cudoniella acicularis]|uniref:Uncharacterized protein n=1 Tax=Cudoniella acicularis TaxID=354080 RepID=A0A8H4RH23_9HELO|nr:hypothetical protein G7Y89_g8168 [Cudoniella acicularis]